MTLINQLLTINSELEVIMSLAIKAQNIYTEYDGLYPVLTEMPKQASSGLERKDWIMLAICIAGIATGILMVAAAISTGNLLLEKSGSTVVTSFICLSIKAFEKII